MNNNDDFEKFVLDREREKSKHDRYMKFEHTLRYMLCELQEETDREDSFLLDDVKQCIHHAKWLLSFLFLT